jgi:hypothetical protein
MEKKVRPFKKTVIFLLTAMLQAALFAGAAFAEPVATGEVTGVFSLNTVPEVTAISLHEVAADDVDIAETLGSGSAVATDSFLTPLHWYDVKVSVTDPDTIGSLDKVRVLFGWSTSGVANKNSHHNSPITVGDTFFPFQWDRASGAVDIVRTSSYAQPWLLSDLYRAPTEDELNSDSFELIFRFRVHKAAYTGNGTGGWYLSAAATDAGTHENWDLNNIEGIKHYDTWGFKGIGKFNMNWYGEIVVPENYTLEWTSVPPGLMFTDERAKVQLSKDITYIANGKYNQTVKASETWVSEGEGANATLKTGDDFNAAQQFGLKAFHQDHENAAVRVLSADFADMLNNVGLTRGGTSSGGTKAKPYFTCACLIHLPKIFISVRSHLV